MAQVTWFSQYDKNGLQVSGLIYDEMLLVTAWLRALLFVALASFPESAERGGARAQDAYVRLSERAQTDPRHVLLHKNTCNRLSFI